MLIKANMNGNKQYKNFMLCISKRYDFDHQNEVKLMKPTQPLTEHGHEIPMPEETDDNFEFKAVIKNKKMFQIC